MWDKAWKALTQRVSAEGRLGYVQTIAENPFLFTEDQYHLYASGTYILAGKEMLKLVRNNE